MNKLKKWEVSFLLLPLLFAARVLDVIGWLMEGSFGLFLFHFDYQSYWRNFYAKMANIVMIGTNNTESRKETLCDDNHNTTNNQLSQENV
ncbi:hypothetical protein BDF20DRAFT_35760 [Mycotypha africana]|uniref:uncharacterized protein n=1 Tax=Mycotypha africana TaxID=64632 RepID=UPI002300AAB3|nr:uncharacterized protein BDF20DRAFT_35760 [Mycotypha africana]KAI8991323.1 hypothetical protein BDF20DRAFT_35760 [Mycotypha africana]